MHPDWTPEEMMFLEDARFAKLVHTPSGPGILIGGMVYTINQPPGSYEIGQSWPDLTTAFVTALRRGGEFGATAANNGAVVGEARTAQ